jgi:hypothetical protein
MWLFRGHSYKVNHLAYTRCAVARQLLSSATNRIILKKKFNFIQYGGICLNNCIFKNAYTKISFQQSLPIDNFDPTASVNRQFRSKRVCQ